MQTVDLSRFEVLTFDCYGTLIDWEAGIAGGAPRGPRSRGASTAADEDLLERYARHEAARRGRAVRALPRACWRARLRGVCAELGVEPTAAELAAFGGSVGDWPAFPDSADALARLASRFRLAVITNCDDDLFAAVEPAAGRDVRLA